MKSRKKSSCNFRLWAAYFPIVFITFLALGNCTVQPSESSSSSRQSSAAAGIPKIVLRAVVSNLAAERLTSFYFRDQLPPQNSVNATPDIYKLALVNFWLINTNNEDINIINTNTSSPVYTETNPLIINFSSSSLVQELFSASNLATGVYKGYKIQFLYMEMRLPVVFHIPFTNYETDITNLEFIIDKTNNLNFRLYFNAIGKFWKRDFVVEIPENSGNWYWLRRSIETNNTDTKNFFISVNSNHPAGGSGPQSTIDLFSDDDFWGSTNYYNNSSYPIIVGTHTNLGGVNAFLENNFTIPSVLDGTYTIDLKVDVMNLLNFSDETNYISNVTFSSNLLDLGPAFGMPFYGDKGLHPFLPRFNVTVTKI